MTLETLEKFSPMVSFVNAPKTTKSAVCQSNNVLLCKDDIVYE